ncbi:response regulator transcription factor [Streptomyces sp. NPDC048417]|uniref:response regulator transcription factor n=1 Tax=Streptomyces sp. NPDC048417 TaxID=3155387 RepID=UPI003440FCE1
MIRVLLADDEHLIRGALVTLLRLESDLEVVADAGEGVRILDLALRTRPDVAVIDVNMPDLNGLEAAAQLLEHLPSCRVLLLSSLDQSGTVRRALELKVGGYLLKDAAPGELIMAIRQVAEGQRIIASELMLAAWDTNANPLTTRETKVLQMTSEGMGVREVADGLHLSLGTVRNYLSSAVSKLGARNRLDAVRIAVEAGWLLSLTPAGSGRSRASESPR